MQKRSAVGTVRWDAQMGNLLDKVSKEEKEILSYPQFHHRLPFYARIPEDGRALYKTWVAEGRQWFAKNSTDAAARYCAGIEVHEATQTVIDQEIAYAVDAGIDYWAFWWGGNDNSCHQPSLLHLYLSSKNKNGLKWCTLYSSGSQTTSDENWLVEKMCEPDYFKVLNNRPLIFTPVDFFTPDIIDKNINSIRNKCMARGLEPYVVALAFHVGGQRLADLAKNIDADALSWYSCQMFDEVNPYSYIMDRDAKKWDLAAATGMQVIPGLGTGWDCRPRNRIDIKRDYLFLGGYETGYVSPDATPDEIEESLGRAMKWNADRGHPEINPNTVLIYAWNEFSEAGVSVCPQYDPDNPDVPNRACLDAVKKAIINAPPLSESATTSLIPVNMTPTVFLSTTAIEPVSGPFMLSIHFSESVNGLSGESFKTSGCSLSGFKGTDDLYSIIVTPEKLNDDEIIKISINENTIKTKSGITNNESHPFVIKYIRPRYPVVFDTNGGVLDEAAYAIAVGDTMPEPKNPKRTGYEFTGWYTDQEFTYKWNFESNKLTGQMTLYAKWEVIDEIPDLKLGWLTHFIQ